MAYAALVSLSETIHKLLQDHDDQDSTFLYEKQQIRHLHENLIFLQEFLEDFPENAKQWEARIRDVAHEAQDISEIFLSKEVQSIVKSAAYQGELRLCLDFRALDYKLQNVEEEFDAIKVEVMETTKDVQLNDSSEFASTSVPRRFAPTGKDTMVGFEDNLLAIKTRLCGDSSKLEIIPIFGMGGIGKTTLAWNAFDDQLSVDHFDIRAWVTVSQNYSARDIISCLLVSLEGERPRPSSVSQMAERAYKSLKGRRYLIVMDDMWSVKAWDDIKLIFPNDHNGSRVMLTTRLADVAAYPDPSSPLHEMSFMNVNQSWDLIKQKVFPREDCPGELEIIGKEIARSCGGLPLAIVLIAGLLTTVKRTQTSWEKIARKVDLDEQLERRVLSLSFNNLPHRLRPCFLYMGSFPEDYEIRVSRLVKLWVAEGFIRPRESKSFEETAKEYLEELVKRSLVLVTKRKANGKIKSCSVHDLLRDLCKRKAQEEKFYLNVINRHVPSGVLKSIKNQRRIIIVHSHHHQDFLEDIHGSNVRTVIYFHFDETCFGSFCFQCVRSSLNFLRKFRLLKVLDVRIKAFQKLPDEVFELFHLRFLAFAPTRIPATISNLRNLQTLIIYQPGTGWNSLQFMVCLPSEIWRMPQLRHLVSLFTGLLPNLEGETFALENLQTISEVIDLICNERILKMIPNVNKMGISYVGDVFVDDYHLDNLVYLHQLEKLKLKIYPGFRGKLNPMFPRTLRELTLSCLQLPWGDMGIVGSLPKLEVLKLRDYACIGNQWETTEGEFPQLKYLLIGESNLQHWTTQSSHFPSLQCLAFHFCWYLSEIPDGIVEIPTLELIEVDDENISLFESAYAKQKEQQSYGNDALQVRKRLCFQ